jgi:hypothetical protein
MINTAPQYGSGCIPSSTTNLGERKLDAPHLTLVAEAVFADNLQFGIAVMRLGTVDLSRGKLLLSGLVSCHVQTCRLERTSRDLVGFGVAATVVKLAHVLRGYEEVE